ncbi:trypsin-like serine protease [Hesseltinella vesiculosa]|uniref:Trypsin-like serine protease n=1 Tax=Hesseltinella vesiculosa TaxID=101127 RepID=A0A1X2GUS2_9FUNG|nr:trypsin-like serine protease [Hesseltinella vesiculosa]
MSVAPATDDYLVDRDPLYHALTMDTKDRRPPFPLQPHHHQKPAPDLSSLHTVPRPASWETTLDRCIKSIVSIKATRVRPLDTEIPGVFSATGFVVDAKRGLILSNRHVVSVAPIVAQAVLCNYEEIDLQPIYRDPIHDFGFLKFDPAHIRFLDLPAIHLDPQGARVGQEIRVVGNDAGEKLSILSGTLARLDRQAPEYGTGEYNDFNTFYYQAASGTSAGSSGSPVLDVHGHAIALNAGGATRSASSYYLPLHRVQRALECLQQQLPIQRGTLQMEMVYRSYNELHQLGLAPYIEQRLRSLASSTANTAADGLLVVKSLLPDGPAADCCEPGDILLTGNGRILASFIDFEDLLDRHVGESVTFVFSRAGKLVECNMVVQDMHQLVPHRFVEFGGGTVHDLSYQMAHSYGLSLRNPGVYVAAAGYILATAYCLRRSVVLAINHQPIHDLDDMLRILQAIPHGARVPIRYYSLSRPKKEKVMLLHVDRRWHSFWLVNRNDTNGLWDYQSLTPLPITDAVPNKVIELPTSTHDPSDTTKAIQHLTHSLVSIDCYLPYVIDGLQSSHTFGAGLVVSLDPPLILCDRDSIQVAICDISVTFRNAITVSAQVLFLHPFYNYAILSFDLATLTTAGYHPHVATFSTKELHRNDPVHYIGLGGDSVPVVKKSYIAARRRIRSKECKVPRYRAVNCEVLKAGGESLNGQGGVLADDDGQVQAFWMNFSIEDDNEEQRAIMGGLPTSLWLDMVNVLRQGSSPVIYGLEAECWSMQLAHARLLQLPDHWIHQFSELPSPHVHYVLGFTNPSSPCASVLQVGDLLLQINGQLITSVNDFQKVDQQANTNMTVFRDGQELQLQVPLTKFDGQETTRIIGWQGMYIQEAYQAAKEQMREHIPLGVYLSCCLFGSPAQVAIQAGVWITEIDQKPVPTLDAFLDVVTRLTNDIQSPTASTNDALAALSLDVPKKMGNASWLLSQPSATVSNSHGPTDQQQKTHVRIKYVTLNNVTHVTMLRLDLHYWPTWQVVKDASHSLGWMLTSYPN